MVIGLTEDFSTQVALDSELQAIPSNGIYINSGVHPMVTLKNLLNFLPNETFTFAAYDPTIEYKPFDETRNISSVVLHSGDIYQCILTTTGNLPTDTTYWIKTNIESLRLKAFLLKVLDKVKSDLSLEHRLIDNQYLYEIGKHKHIPEGDYFGWAIEPKNSDYVRLCLNEMSIQNTASGNVNVYVVNQGQLLETFVVAGGNEQVKFERTDYCFIGKGTFYFLVEKQEIMRNGAFTDYLRYDGFVAYPVNADGSSWDALDYTPNTIGNGIGINISAYLDSSVYITNNLKHIGTYIRQTFEYMAFQMFAQNANSRLNAEVRDQMNEKIVLAELKDMETDTVVSRYIKERKKAMQIIQKTFDRHLHESDEITITVGSI